jgi:hypothetical protein
LARAQDTGIDVLRAGIGGNVSSIPQRGKTVFHGESWKSTAFVVVPEAGIQSLEESKA